LSSDVISIPPAHLGDPIPVARDGAEQVVR
jgi:hypothetical protein